jgi:Holliday junction resolvase RusA-like endonuclease
MDMVKRCISFEVDLEPGHLRTNAARRATRAGGRIVVHKTPEYREAQRRVRVAARRAADGWQLEGPVHVHITTTVRRLHRQGPANGLPFIDVDAVVKGVLDALEHAEIFANDAQVSLLTANKQHDADNPGLLVFASEIGPDESDALTRALMEATRGHG